MKKIFNRVGTGALVLLALALVWAALEWSGVAADFGREASADPARAPQDVAAAAQQPAARPRPPALDTRRMQVVQILDRGISNPPTVVAELQIPQGWSPVGGVTWNDQTPCGGNQIQVNWTAFAPDSLTALAILPGFSWQVTGRQQRFNPCPVAPLASVRAFLEATARNLRPNAQLLGYEDVAPEPARAGDPAPAPGVQVRKEAGRLYIAYDDNGIAMQELLSANVVFTTVQDSVMGGVGLVDSLRAPAGRLDAPLLQRVRSSVRMDPQWVTASSARVRASVNRYHAGVNTKINDWHNRQMAMINARGEAERHAIRMRSNQEVAGIYNSIAANTSATNDRIHRRTLEGIGEYNTFNGVNGSTVHNSIHNGQRVFQDANQPNNAYSTNQPYAQPPAGYTELERRR